MTGRNTFLFPILITLAGLLAYANTFAVPFHFDDEAYIVSNPIIRTFHFFSDPSAVLSLSEQSPLSVPPALRYAFLTRIVTYLSFALNYHLHGLDVAGYHIVNLAIHILSGLVVYQLVMTLLRAGHLHGRVAASEAFSQEFMAGAAALLFVSHPIQTQAVTYISQRFASLASLFFLAALLLYARSVLLPAGLQRKAAYCSSFLLTIAAMLTKEFTITLPVVVALCDALFLPGSRGARLRRLAPFAATLLIIPALVFLKQGTMGALDSTMRTITAADVTNIPSTHYLLTQFRVVVLYLRLLFFPINQNVDHDIPVYTSLFDMPVLFCSLLLLGLLLWGVYLFILSRREGGFPEPRLASFGIFWFFITMSVESSVIPLGELVAEYRMYLPSVGMILVFVSLLAYVSRRSESLRALQPEVIYGLLGTLVLTLAVGTYVRNAVWSGEISLWEDAAGKSPLKLRPHQNLGTHYMLQGRLQDAERELLAALQLSPNAFELHNNLGILYKKKGDYGRAEQEFMTVARLAPADPMAHYNLGNVYLLQGYLERAIGEYRESIRLAPDYDEAHNNIGIAYAKSGRCSEAILEFNRAISLNPNNASARQNMKACLRSEVKP